MPFLKVCPLNKINFRRPWPRQSQFIHCKELKRERNSYPKETLQKLKPVSRLDASPGWQNYKSDASSDTVYTLMLMFSRHFVISQDLLVLTTIQSFEGLLGSWYLCLCMLHCPLVVRLWYCPWRSSDTWNESLVKMSILLLPRGDWHFKGRP